jgi:hypothetical protein
MKIKSTLLLLVSIIALSLHSAKAQTATPPSAAGIKAAKDMLIASGANQQFQKNISTMIAQYSGQMPEDKRTKFVEVMTTFMNKYISWEVLKHDLSVMYAREFSEDELNQLTAFYKTPIGIKLNQKQPVLMQAGMALGQQSVMAHQDELQQMIAEAMK